MTGHIENGEERQVKTPWFEEKIPFTKAAGVGTRKVIHDHATIGMLVTTDGSIGELPRENYMDAESKVVQELKRAGKPFVIILNTKKPHAESSRKLAGELETLYQEKVLPLDCEQMREDDIHKIMEQILCSFPVSEMNFYIPKWVEMLPKEHLVKEELLAFVRQMLEKIQMIRDVEEGIRLPKEGCVKSIKVDRISMDTGAVDVRIEVDDTYYYEMLSEMIGSEICSEYDLLGLLKEMAVLKKEYDVVKDALSAVKIKGYGVVTPKKDDIHLEEPIIIKQGNKFGVKIHSEAPSIHMIKANIETEIAPIVGSEQQAQDLVTYIKDAGKGEEGIWNTNIFGKSIEDLVMEGMRQKITMINDESQVKLQDTMQKVVNDSNGGLVCIII